MHASWSFCDQHIFAIIKRRRRCAVVNFLVLYFEFIGMSIHEQSAEPTSGRRKCCRCNGDNARCKFCACTKANRACTNCLLSKYGCCQNTSSELIASSNAPTLRSLPFYQHTSQFSDTQQLPLLQLPSTSIGLHFFGSPSPSHLAIGVESQCSQQEPNLTIGSISTSQPSPHTSPISTDPQQWYILTTRIDQPYSPSPFPSSQPSYRMDSSSSQRYHSPFQASLPMPQQSLPLSQLPLTMSQSPLFIFQLPLPHTLLPRSQRSPPSSQLPPNLLQLSSQLPSSQPNDHLAGMPAQHVALHQEELARPFQTSHRKKKKANLIWRWFEVIPSIYQQIPLSEKSNGDCSVHS